MILSNGIYKIRNLLFCVALLLPFGSQAQVFNILVSAPQTDAQYEHMFDYEPRAGEVAAINQAIENESIDSTYLNSKADLLNMLSSNDNRPIILVGHNEAGEFRFGKGESVSLAEIERLASAADKHITILSCRASKYTEVPATRFKTDFAAAMQLSTLIDETIEPDKNRYFSTDIAANVDKAEASSRDDLASQNADKILSVNHQSSPVQTHSGLGSSVQDSSDKSCFELLSILVASTRTVITGVTDKAGLNTAVSAVIRRSELSGLLTGTYARITGLGAGSTVVVVAWEPKPDKQ